MSRLRVDLAQLDALIVHLHRVGDELERLQGEVDARVRPGHVAWTGRAAAAHEAASAQWSAGAAELNEALAGLRHVAATAHGNYEAAVAANRRMWAP